MNTLYLISYDLENATSEEYAALIEYIKGLATNGWNHPLKSTFMVITTKSKDEIHNGIKKVLTSKEGVLRTGSRWMITPIALGKSTGWLGQSDIDWWSKAVNAGY